MRKHTERINAGKERFLLEHLVLGPVHPGEEGAGHLKEAGHSFSVFRDRDQESLC